MLNEDDFQAVAEMIDGYVSTKDKSKSEQEEAFAIYALLAVLFATSPNPTALYVVAKRIGEEFEKLGANPPSLRFVDDCVPRWHARRLINDRRLSSRAA